MKTLTILLSIIAFQYAAFAQQPVSQKGFVLGYTIESSEQGAVKAKFTPSSVRKNIMITSVPLSTRALTSENIVIEISGNFSFKKDKSLDIPFNREVFIEDKLTGRTFNLNSSDIYTFSIEEPVKDRFVMHVLDKSNVEAMFSSN